MNKEIKNTEKTGWKFKLLLGLIIFLGFFFRIYGLNKTNGLWLDEVFSHYVAKESFPFGILNITFNEDTHMPLYYFFLHFWMKFFGDGDLGLRFLSVIFGTLTIPTIYKAGKELISKYVGLVAALLVSFNGLLIYYSQEVRMYSLIGFISSIILYLLAKSFKNPTWPNLLGLTLANIALISSYTIGFIFVFAEIFLAGIYIFYRHRASFKKFIISQSITFLVFLMFIFVVKTNLYNLFLAVSDESRNLTNQPLRFSSILFFLQSIFSPFIRSIYKPDENYLKFVLDNINHPLFLFYTIIPVLIGIGTVIKGALEKKDNLVIAGFTGIFFCSLLLAAFAEKMAFFHDMAL